jgi:hypothetical protein
LGHQPQGACHCQHQTQRVRTDHPPPLATLILAKTIKRLAIADIDFYRPAVAVVFQEIVHTERQVSREKGFNGGPGASVARHVGPLGSVSAHYDNADGPTRQDRMPQSQPGLDLRSGF